MDGKDGATGATGEAATGATGGFGPTGPTGPTGANGSLCVGPPVYLSFDETEGANPIANADNSDRKLAAADGPSRDPALPTSYTYHGLQLAPLEGTTSITDKDQLFSGGPTFNTNSSLLLTVDSANPSVSSLTLSAAAGSFSVFSLYTYSLNPLGCGGGNAVTIVGGPQKRRLTQCNTPGVQIIGTLAGARVGACEVGTISLVQLSPQYVVFPPGCVVDTLQFVPEGVSDLVIDNVVTCAATADSSLTLAA